MRACISEKSLPTLKFGNMMFVEEYILGAS
jgi:hypothetical protein